MSSPTFARVVKTPAGLAWQLSDPAGGRLRRTLLVVLHTRLGGEVRLRLPVENRELGDYVVFRGDGLVRPEDGPVEEPWVTIDGGPR